MSGGIVWLASYPKSGNTWMRILLQNLEEGDTGEGADINRLTFGMVASARNWLDDIFGFASADLSDDEIDCLRPYAYDWIRPDTDPPYYLKIHDACHSAENGICLLGQSPGQRAVYLVRNPLDLALSYSNHLGRSLDDTITLMGDPTHALATSDTALRTQVRQTLRTWSEHVSSWLDAPNLSCCVVKYEALLDDPIATVRAVMHFLGWSKDEDALRQAVVRSDFKELRRQEVISGFGERPPGMSVFFRSGRSGEWRERLSAAQIERIIADHGDAMHRLGYVDEARQPV